MAGDIFCVQQIFRAKCLKKIHLIIIAQPGNGFYPAILFHEKSKSVRVLFSVHR